MLICFHDKFAGLGFLTSLVFIFMVGIFVSSWVGSTIFWVGEWFIKKMPFVRHIYSASKQVSTAISPGYILLHRCSDSESFAILCAFSWSAFNKLC